jgi:hypothetical protein
MKRLLLIGAPLLMLSACAAYKMLEQPNPGVDKAGTIYVHKTAEGAFYGYREIPGSLRPSQKSRISRFCNSSGTPAQNRYVTKPLLEM